VELEGLVGVPVQAVGNAAVLLEQAADMVAEGQVVRRTVSFISQYIFVQAIDLDDLPTEWVDLVDLFDRQNQA
jgi:hypothetical protein